MSTVPSDLLKTLERFGQQHCLQFWKDLSETERSQLSCQLRGIDFPQLREITQRLQSDPAACAGGSDRIDRMTAPKHVIYQPATPAETESWKKATGVGEDQIRSGQVAVITVAGGQGTRLGFNLPKGMFPIGPISERSLFQVFAEQILARQKRHSTRLPWLIMTSDATHDETTRFFQDRRFFGLPESSVYFFRQGCLPALDATTGKILLSDRGQLALSPDGHGGLIMALKNAGLLNQMQQEGIDHFYYHQVDNPTAIVANPALLGFHVLSNSQLTTSVVRKTSPTERMGVLVDVDGRTEIVEYSELTPEQAARHDAAGEWIFWAGNTAVHVFDRRFLQRLAEDDHSLPLHVARKNVPFIDEQGNPGRPSDQGQPNGIKLERFIFDALPLAEKTLIVEGNREREFNPVKNKSGADSADTAKDAMNRIARAWLRSAGIAAEDDEQIEVSPLQALCADELQQKLSTGQLQVKEILRRRNAF